MNETSLTPYEKIEELSNGFRLSQVLLSAVRLGIFDALHAHPLTAEELARQLQCDIRGLRILCDALAAVSLLEKKRTALS